MYTMTLKFEKLHHRRRALEISNLVRLPIKSARKKRKLKTYLVIGDISRMYAKI